MKTKKQTVSLLRATSSTSVASKLHTSRSASVISDKQETSSVVRGSCKSRQQKRKRKQSESDDDEDEDVGKDNDFNGKLIFKTMVVDHDE